MRVESAHREALAKAFSHAAVDSFAWFEALDLTARLTRSGRAQLIGIGGPADIPFNWVTDASSDALEEFVAIDGGDPRVSFRVAASLASGDRIVWERDYDEAVPNLVTDTYVDFCAKHRMPFGIQADLYRSGGTMIGFAVLRSEDDGRSTPDERVVFEVAAQYAQEAVRVQLALEGRTATIMAGALDAVSCAAILLDEVGDVIAITPTAEHLLAGCSAVRIRNRRLETTHPADRNELAQAIASALGTDHETSTCRCQVLRPLEQSEDLLIVDVISLPAERWSFGFRPRLVVKLRRPGASGAAAELLQKAMGLTASEAAVAALLAEGLGRSEIAARRCVSTSTVQAQLRSIFEKANVARETALVARIRDLLG